MLAWRISDNPIGWACGWWVRTIDPIDCVTMVRLLCAVYFTDIMLLQLIRIGFVFHW